MQPLTNGTIMKTLSVLTLATALCLGAPAVAQIAQDSSYTTDPTDRSDHYNNQSSIVPDTVPDKVTHGDHGQLKSDRAAIEADRKDLAAHQAHENEQMKKEQQDLQGNANAGQTHPIPTQ
jgi:tRNA G37 N-methylase TrmD